ncbi:tripartite tricarboxylate transporter substrate binding protein [Chelativorans sp. AA-79]|uniref:Bug family tripartite tricarboxylate transporter substrate binding protein n=1 Tax=Chelativorans sp. AA-79 TaxID=3028735 RepID=UPI0023F9E3EB|nr:tripartite tricarboxylate transporter substrate binding protein [Chelativorans sp. AA-79]WEX08090.1 tripartite tricarboxylate transporter substrate binding protein [Chelativorans sp. AA-79]
MKPFSKIASAIAVGAMMVAAAVTGAAAAYPERQIKIIIGFPPGGADTFTRMIAEYMQNKLGVPVVVENVPGASGTIGATQVVDAPADGYTLFFATNGPGANAKLLYPDLPYDPLVDLDPVIRLGESTMVITANADQPYSNLEEMIAYAKEHPGEISVAHPGYGGLGHVAMEYIKREAGIDVNIVPYTGSGTLIPDLLANHVQTSSDSLPSYMQHVEAGTIKFLAQLGPKRNPMIPDVPTVRESGLDMESFIWYGIFAPKGTPEEAVKVLNTVITEYLQTDEAKEKLAAMRIIADPTTPEVLRQTQTDEIEQWGPVVKDLGIVIK